MRLLTIKTPTFPTIYRTAKKLLLNISLILCILLSSCTAIRDATNRALRTKTKPQPDTTKVETSTFSQCSPIKGRVISPFGYRGREKHTGTDIKLAKGDTVRAAFCGHVTKASPYSGYGNLIILKHANSVETYYAHLSKCLVHVGDTIVAGEPIGLGGRTGRATTDHLHFEVRYNNIPNNPENFFDFRTATVRIPILAYSPTSKTKIQPTFKISISDIASTSETPSVLENTVNTENMVVIKKGDTLYAIARQYATTVKHIQELNNLTGSSLKLGMKLKIKE